MCCILRRGCRKETTQEGHKRYRFRSDWDKSGTMTSSETRITEAIPPNDNASTSAATGDKNNPTGVLVRIEEETAAESYAKTDGCSSPKNESSDNRTGDNDTHLEENGCQHENNKASCESEEELRLMDGHCKRAINHADNMDTTCSCITTHLSSKKKREKHFTKFEEADSSNCSTGESFKELINDSDTAGLSEEE